MADIDIELAIGSTGVYLVVFRDKNNPGGVDVSGFTGGTITFTTLQDMNTSLGTATMSNFGTGGGQADNFTAQFTIPTSHSMTVGDKAYKDYAAQVVLTGSGTRLTKLLSVRMYKKLGVST